MYFKSLWILVVLCCCFRVTGQTTNPLLDMVGKPYSEYHDTYVHVMDSLFWGDSLHRASAVQLFEEAAAADSTGEWDLICNIIKCDARFYESRDGGFVASADYTAIDYAGDLLSLANEAGDKGLPLIRILSLWYVAQTYHLFIHDYERAFTFFVELAAELETRTTKEFPLRPYCYLEIANLYFTFREYGEAAVYYRKMADDPDAATNYYKPLYQALSGLGGCYRNTGDFVKSDSCYRQILAMVASDETDNYVWGGITACDIGYNYHLQGDDDAALEWLVPAIETITRENDAAYVSLRATTIAGIYLKKDNPSQAKRYLDMALDFHERSRLPDMDSRLYNLLGRYYFYIGDKAKANAFLDSALTAVKLENDAFSGLVLRRVEQRLRVADQTIHEQELSAEKTRSKVYRQTTLIVSMSLVVILVLLGLTFVYWRRTRYAYRSLVLRSQHWAGIEIPDNPLPQDDDADTVQEEITEPDEKEKEKPTDLSDSADTTIMKDIERLMSEEKLFREITLSVDSLAHKLGVKRYYISEAINHCTQKSFNTFVNEYRIKEAIRLLSAKENEAIPIDDIAFDSGFNDRKNFYRVFKKMTGLSPSGFRNNTNFLSNSQIKS